jgi:hypothetical protein
VAISESYLVDQRLLRTPLQIPAPPVAARNFVSYASGLTRMPQRTRHAGELGICRIITWY